MLTFGRERIPQLTTIRSHSIPGGSFNPRREKPSESFVLGNGIICCLPQQETRSSKEDKDTWSRTGHKQMAVRFQRLKAMAGRQDGHSRNEKMSE